jgi:pheromone shutdown protein TraB
MLNVDVVRAVLAAGHPDTAVVGVTMAWLRAAAPLLGITVPDMSAPITGVILDVAAPIAVGEPGASA